MQQFIPIGFTTIFAFLVRRINILLDMNLKCKALSLSFRFYVDSDAERGNSIQQCCEQRGRIIPAAIIFIIYPLLNDSYQRDANLLFDILLLNLHLIVNNLPGKLDKLENYFYLFGKYCTITSSILEVPWTSKLIKLPYRSHL